MARVRRKERKSDGTQRYSAGAAESSWRAVPNGELVTAVATAHRQVVASNGAEVDEEIKDLLEALWTRGMVTEFSCQGERDKLAHICFTHAADASRFTEAPGDFLITLGVSRAWVDYPAHLIGELTRFWSS